jgi:hypothetical protein
MDLNNLFAGVTVPGWAVLAGGFAVLLLLFSMVRPRAAATSSGGASGMSTLVQLAMVAVVAGAAYFGLKQLEESSRFAERRVIEDRAANLLSQANQPGSVLGCLNAAVTPVLDEACEKQIFAEPQRLASAVGMTAERIALLSDATNYATREPAFLDRFDHLRKSIEADPFGLVAHVFAVEHKCIPDSCTRFRLLKETDRIKANLTARKFDGLLAKYSPGWVHIRPGMNTSALPAMPPINTIGGKVNDKELPTANTALQMVPPSGQTANTPVLLPPVNAQPTANNQPPASTPVSIPQTPAAAPQAKQKAAPAAQQKQQPPSQQAKRKSGPPEPVGGLPRVTARGNQNAAPEEEEDDTPTATPQPAPPTSIFQRR